MRYQRLILYLLLTSAALAMLAPLLFMISTSLKPMDEIRDGSLFALPHAPTLAAWAKAWNGACIGDSCEGLSGQFANSFIIVLPSLFLSVGLGALTGYALSLWRVPYANVLFSAILLGLFIPPQVTLYPMIIMVRELGLFGSVSGLVLVHVVWGMAFVTLLFRNFFQSVPQDLLKAARIDGAGFFAIFWYVMLPLSLPVFAVAVILQFTYIWNDFLLGLTFSSPESQPVTVALNNLVGSQFGEQEYNLNMAATMLTALPTVLVYLFSGRLFVRGIAAGAVKG
ncbi:carbohydrate ABC transporter permease [Vitiosangium sp. GDMCC 1.1324]|uniref:carbohydrate ABC transporter permease n=1 Tax=Vitiosangium sp. (strain GDMCC 1.1324) TaxID=2138576 RepID=UPI000D3A284E|nr:carbohydrate ABC transporter permease [Vitiosangium sp. GDMCC 1.1324]PTL83729.1 sugar ABC transporter permease [Vitiosangium sp. GDMCC 1.1324]